MKVLPAVLALLLGAAVQDSASKVACEARFAGPAQAGGTVRLEVKLTMAEGWHVYGPGDPYEGQPVSLSVRSGGEGLSFGPFRPTRDPVPHPYEFEDKPRMEYEGTVTYVSDVKIPAGTAAGERTVAGVATVNACDAGACLAEGNSPWSAKLVVAPGVAPPAAPVGEEGGISLAFLLTAVVAGLLTIATPCVFPMIPLTVSLLTKRAEKEPGRVLSSAVAYGAGMFVSLAGIGLAMSLVLGVAPSDLALSPAFNIAIFLFLGYLALSLFGAYDIQLPAFMTDWAQSKAGTGGGAGLFFMGVVLAFTSFACAAPFAGVLLVEARTSVVKGVVGMGVYAATFTIPFFLTALFPGVLKGLPRSGGWLNAVKVVMGFVEVAAAFKFLRNAFTAFGSEALSFEMVLAVWIACALGAALYLLGFIVLPHDTKPEGIGVGRLLWALLFLACGVFLVPGLFGRRIPAYVESFIIRPEETADAGGRPKGGGDSLPWILNDLDLALKTAQAEGRPVFVDFTGHG
jgi:thiol:disulfide interchange protein